MEKYLAIDSDIELAERENAVWLEKRGISMDRVDTMTEAIKLLMSKLSDKYLYIGINGDAVIWVPLLSAMREITDTPILIATNNFTAEKEAIAMSNGATFYGRYHPTTEENIKSVFTWIESATKKDENKLPSRRVMAYKNLIVLPHRYQCGVFLDNVNIDMTYQEFSLLNILMENRGNVLTYELIYSHVWGDEYDDAVNGVIMSAIIRLRKQLGCEETDNSIIENVRGVGYKFSAI